MATYFCVNSSLGGQIWNSSNTTIWSTTSGVTTTPTGPPAAGDTVTLDALSGGGTITVGTSINTTNTVTNITMGTFTGTLDFSVNNPSITVTTAFINSGTGTRTLNLGSGTFKLSATNGTVWDFTTVTGLTFSASASTLLVSGSLTNQRSIILGTSMSYNIITITNTGSQCMRTILTSASSVATLNLTPPLWVQPNGNWTIASALNISGTAYNNTVTMLAFDATTTWTLGASGGAANWCAIGNMTFATNSLTATNSFDLKGNSNVTITGPSGGGGFVIGN
jgi:hypothetical protein